MMAPLVWFACVALTAGTQAAPPSKTIDPAFVGEIVRADYGGDRAALLRLYEELQPVEGGPAPIAARVRYWRGFARWRRAINGFNDAADRTELEDDLRTGLREFEQAMSLDAAFVDAKVGAISCLQYLTFLHRLDPAQVGELVPRSVALMKEAQAEAPDNPRLLWVQGASQWYTPPNTPLAKAQERHSTALATYARGLELARKQKGISRDPLDPVWGEPELLMNLAWSHLNSTPPDLESAERYANEALALVPDWHYVRDTLVPQIKKAKGGE